MKRDRAVLVLPLTAALASMLPQGLSALPADERAAIQAELSGPIVLQLHQGQRITGIPTKVSEGQIQITKVEGISEITFTVESSRIKEITLPGDSYKSLAVEWMQADKHEDALELMGLLFEQRKILLPLLPPSESHFFFYYVELVLRSPHPARAIALLEILRPQIEHPAALRALEDMTLESYHNFELHDEARPLAEAWVQARKPYGESALGYYVLGAALLREQAHEAALDLALRPIVYATPIPTKYMGECYAVAVSAALNLRERAYAGILFREMRSRGLEWPGEDRTLAPFLKDITEYLAEHEDESSRSKK